MGKVISSVVASTVMLFSAMGITSLPAFAAGPPAGAVSLSNGVPYANYATATGETHWYRIDSSSNQKITARLEGPSITAVDYDLRLYRYDVASGSLVKTSESLNRATAIEQASAIASPGTYYVEVASISGLDVQNPYRLTYVTSLSYDSSEADDSPWQAPSLPVSATMTLTNRTKDNGWDEDWNRIVLSKDAIMAFLVHKNDDRSIPFGQQSLQIYDNTLTLKHTIPAFTFKSVSMSAGVYYLNFPGTGAGTGYSLRFSDKTPLPASRVQVTDIATDGGVYGFINYGQGNKWRVKQNIVVTGTAYSSANLAVANAQITIEIKPTGSTTPVRAAGTTDANGVFSIPVVLPAAGGYYSYDNVVSMHYYDIITFKAFSSNVSMTSNIADLYHFAYSIYTPH